MRQVLNQRVEPGIELRQLVGVAAHMQHRARQRPDLVVALGEPLGEVLLRSAVSPRLRPVSAKLSSALVSALIGLRTRVWK